MATGTGPGDEAGIPRGPAPAHQWAQSGSSFTDMNSARALLPFIPGPPGGPSEQLQMRCLWPWRCVPGQRREWTGGEGVQEGP